MQLLPLMIANRRAARQKEVARQNVRRILLTAALMRLRGLLRERSFIHSSSLLCDQTDAPWYHFYMRRDVPSFISLVSLTPAAFDALLSVFACFYVVVSGSGRRGRPSRIPRLHCVLGLLLTYYTTPTEQKLLCKSFAVAPSTLSRVLTNAEAALNKALRQMHDAAVRWPSQAVQQTWAAATQRREPRVKGVVGFVDGNNLRVQEPSNSELQNAPHNGKMQSVSRKLQEKIAREGCKLCADTAFPVRGLVEGKIITPIKEGDIDRYHPACRLGVQALSDSITSLRQAAEWGMGAVDKVLPSGCLFHTNRLYARNAWTTSSDFTTFEFVRPA
ncbi:hypothetical protein ACHHYP_10059 [Achlya hypogyna]|uniref:DDE Tnp4 domain-containing protein n=1 Tax=Achlya hypogyna TaxID=1202772 RepID=A0A1V9ZIF5_ACHHY|nr:hypothetical protein ACHHYP_10059 [Achlya hypogyna]